MVTRHLVLLRISFKTHSTGYFSVRAELELTVKLLILLLGNIMDTFPTGKEYSSLWRIGALSLTGAANVEITTSTATNSLLVA